MKNISWLLFSFCQPWVPYDPKLLYLESVARLFLPMGKCRNLLFAVFSPLHPTQRGLRTVRYWHLCLVGIIGVYLLYLLIHTTNLLLPAMSVNNARRKM